MPDNTPTSNCQFSATINIQPLRRRSGERQYHIEMNFENGFSSLILASTLETILPVAFEHIDGLVDEGVISKCSPPYQITFADERSAESAPDT